ncbi:predicted protein [Uncinocarpus reesii 1704]|uniref:FAD-binding domain-containing protein n=1 Tax=Uncinocarpus reesii (strain UAMH 1704) TaxID=336963 RepID=C4JZR3_UNCRE|nr:uncharacterized protein UREG_07664 [Uncinocarpus reesii 1704]EEP82799.1 predicted protein [Uncinocarpus reesii 1704]
MAVYAGDTPTPTGIKVIIVGLGIAGLSAAIECHRKGHEVVVYEKLPRLKGVEGDGITIGANGAIVTAKWGDGAFHDMVRPLEYKTNRAKVFDYTGYAYGEFELHGYNEGRGYTANRGALVSVMYEYSQTLGIKVFLDSTVTDYWESESEAGVVVNGERVAADCVICAEGIHSPGRKIITGQEMELQETGFSATRGYLDANIVAQDSKLSWIIDDIETEDCIYGWLGPRVHFGITTKKKDNELFWYCCHQRRLIVVGDAAHAALPSSGQGGTQAIEDAAVLAIALELAGKQDVPLALAVSEKLRYSTTFLDPSWRQRSSIENPYRYQRARIVQQGGLAVLQFVMNHVDFEGLRKDPTMVKPPHPAWILDHDCQEYAVREFPAAAEAVRTGGDYVPHNIPSDGQYRMEYNSK